MTTEVCLRRGRTASERLNETVGKTNVENSKHPDVTCEPRTDVRAVIWCDGSAFILKWSVSEATDQMFC